MTERISLSPILDDELSCQPGACKHACTTLSPTLILFDFCLLELGGAFQPKVAVISDFSGELMLYECQYVVNKQFFCDSREEKSKLI